LFFTAAVPEPLFPKLETLLGAGGMFQAALKVVVTGPRVADVTVPLAQRVSTE
jgi:hypothetical protein